MPLKGTKRMLVPSEARMAERLGCDDENSILIIDGKEYLVQPVQGEVLEGNRSYKEFMLLPLKKR